MEYNLFLDDQRLPPENGKTWVIARSVDQAISIINERGLPSFISFDHDLGEDTPTGYDLAKWIGIAILDKFGKFPDGFSFYVHSQNPVGAENIREYLNNLLNFLKFNAKETEGE